jgi:superfamily II DNA/RNA helicase
VSFQPPPLNGNIKKVFRRQKLLEILNSGQYPSPIIVFVNQKKTADMVAKDLSRAGVRFSWIFFFFRMKHGAKN